MTRVAPALALLAGLCAAGCKKDEFQKVYPVSGRVVVDGNPAHDCMVKLNRTFDDPHPRKVVPYGLTNEQGEFKVTSYVTGDGAPEGEYVVTVEWRLRSGVLGQNYEGPDLLDGAFAKPDATKANPQFVVKVGGGPAELPPFEITLTPEQRKKMEDRRKRAAKGPTLGGDR
jgi:hypothetical protein